jgi:glycosyltransferase involved in cell wall biosynthesis
MNIAIIIPTFNRADKLEFCLQNLIAFREKSSHTIDFIICNNQSTDNTKNLLDKISEKYSFIKPFTRKKFQKTGHESAVELINEVSDSYDWYWLFGDDDLIDISDVKQFDEIISNSEIDYIYAPTYYKKITDTPVLDKVQGLVDYFGLIDLFGFFSSQIFSKKAILEIKKSIRSIDHDLEFCFIVPIILYDSISKLNGYIGVNPWIRNINDTPSNGSAEPWFMCEHYFNLANKKNIIKFPKHKEFFLTEKKFLWRNFMCWIISHAVLNKTTANLHLKENILKTIQLCDDQTLIKNDTLLLNISFLLINELYSNHTNVDSELNLSSLKIISEIYHFLNEEFRT